jgi:hypothetical protein
MKIDAARSANVRVPEVHLCEHQSAKLHMISSQKKGETAMGITYTTLNSRLESLCDRSASVAMCPSLTPMGAT